MELLECPLPDCEASGRAVAVFSVDGRFRDVVRHPKDGTVMSLTGFVGVMVSACQPTGTNVRS
jgi:hypothetical protein